MSVTFRSQRLVKLIWILVAVSGCGTASLPPPPSSPASVPAAPSVAPQTVPARSASQTSGPRAESPATASAPSVNAKSDSPEASTKSAGASPLADTKPPVTSVTKAPTVIGKRVEGPAAAGNFIMALARDLDGNVWVGTEDKGVLRGTPNGEWTQFTTQDGLGDDNGYAICCDRLGRVWVGQLNHGVAVFNGETWKTYDVLDGPLGERVFDIACCPTDGDVWLATSAGLSCYSEPDEEGSRLAPRDEARLSQDLPKSVNDRTPTDSRASSRGARRLPWTYLTRADGLPSDQANALAFAPDGTLYVGTQCDGVAIGRADDNYAKWQVVSAAPSDDHYRRPTGKGLPSNLINDVLVASDGTVYVATSLGLAKSKNQGQTWEYIRGRDYADKVKGRLEPPPKTWSPLPKDKLAALLPEDYITAHAEDNAGRLWLGFRQQGFGVIDAKSGASFHGTQETAKLKDTYIAALLPDDTGRALLGGYGGGAMTLKEPVPVGSSKPTVGAAPDKRDATRSPAGQHPPHPMVAAAPTLAQLQSDLSQLRSLKEPLPAVAAVFVGDDWKTQGDWVGRLGRQDTVLCAMGAPLDHYLGTNSHYGIRGTVGPHGTKDEGLRHWCHWEKTDNRRSLYTPLVGYRRQADWDDHGEAYPMSHEGPDVWIEVTVPEGVHRVSLYFFNKDGHDGHNRFRDYLLELKPHHAQPRIADRQPALATARIRQFWGGCYKQFAVRGPGKYWLKLSKNDSFNTIVSGVMIDLMAGWQWPYERMALPVMGNLPYRPPVVPKLFADAPDELLAAVALQAALTDGWLARGGAERQRELFVAAYRAARDHDPPPELLANWHWQLRLWSPDERTEFDAMMARAWQKHLEFNPNLKRQLGLK